MVDYRVLREHFGDKPYQKGDVRALSPAEAKRLLSLGVLAEIKEEPEAPKKEPKISGKARKAAPENK